MVARGKSRVGSLTRLPDGVQSHGVIKLLQQRQDSEHVVRIRRNIGFLGLERKGRRRPIEVKRERYVLRQGAGCVRLPMFIVKLAHRLSTFLGFGRGLDGFSHLGANLVSQRMRDAEFLIISASINSGQNREQGFTRVQRHCGRALAHRHLRQQSNQDSAPRVSKSKKQGTSFRQVDMFQFKGFQAEGQTMDKPSA